MTNQQKEILATIPKKDRGLYGEDLASDEDDGEAPDLVDIENDPLEAAVKRAKIKQQALKERRRKREKEEDEAEGRKRVRFVDDVEVEEGSGLESEEMGENSDDLMYDSEEEEKEEQEY